MSLTDDIIAGRGPFYMSANELRRAFGQIEVTAYGDTERSWLVPVKDSMGNLTSSYTYQTLLNSSNSASVNYYYDPLTQPMVQRQPEAVFLAPPKKLTPEEELISWLRTRVDEICWKP